MRKEIFKCDKCGVDIDRDKDSNYYEVRECLTPGWAQIDRSFGMAGTKQLCKKCIKVLKLDFNKVNYTN